MQPVEGRIRSLELSACLRHCLDEDGYVNAGPGVSVVICVTLTSLGEVWRAEERAQVEDYGKIVALACFGPGQQRTDSPQLARRPAPRR